MKLVFALGIAALIAGCGADGAPVRPEVSAQTTVGVNSKSGVFSRNSVGIEVNL
ncbi:hypothetical protein [Poseidonocella sedimentorum]|uniref:Uncharacterized protein n=1 Tax=Poseidonocella sedimentorum TaxID=871652 RepID=A0A1I6D9X7_9RHOB|nr:hypothetical protein [Poseidonocella sedimentorum]SFR02253.1 hypothetical protein SAMN04515673_102485 [Poseidonocella sedimentorum]